MKYANKLILTFLLTLTLYSCAQEKANQLNMEKDIIAFQSLMYNKIKKYDKQPLYLVQVNKNNCRAIVLCNDIPHWLTFYENAGESMALYLNNYIPKSGKQVLTIQVYPKEGDVFITDKALLDLKISFAADKSDDVDAYKMIAKAELPADLGIRKLKYFEFKVPFDATVPFDFSAELSNAQTLTSIANIEQKVLDKYKQLNAFLINEDGLSFVKAFEDSDLKSSTHLYATKEELIADDKSDNMDVKWAKVDVKNRKVNPIENYEMVFFAGGKLVKLRGIKDKKELIRVEFDTAEGVDGNEKPVLLYLPAGSNDLKVW